MEFAAEEMSVCRDTILAFLDYLVDPMLPIDPILKEGITLSPQEMVAKQVHAVVLLYNYYHRKQNPDLAFLEFQTFCKLAVDLKPSLGLYVAVMQKTDNSESEEQDKDLSLTEKAIMSACDISKSLNALYNHPVIDHWPIAGVTVFLVDSEKENCGLFHGSITKGVWSAIEKEVNDESQWSQALVDASKSAKKTKRVMKRKDATGLQQLAYLAVKETCGINQGDLKILDTHVVYSTSKLKTTACLYIMQMQYTPIDKNMILIPVNEVMDNLQGSLIVDKEFVSPVVEYFHLLPFADKVLDWLKREMSQDSVNIVQVKDGTCQLSLSNTEPLPGLPEQNCTIFHDSRKLNLNISDFNEETDEVICGNNCHSKEESIAIAPKDSEEFIAVARSITEKNITLFHDSEELNPNISEFIGATDEVLYENNCDSKEESIAVVPNVSEQNCTIFRDSRELNLNISEITEATDEVIYSNNCHSKEESVAVAPSTFEENYTIFHDSGELNLNISGFVGATDEILCDNNCHSKEELGTVAPKHCEASEARDDNKHHLKEESVVVAPLISEESEPNCTIFNDSGELNLNISGFVGATDEISHSKEELVAVAPKDCEGSESRNGESFPHASQPCAEHAEFHSDELHPRNERHPESVERVNGFIVYRRKEKRKRLQNNLMLSAQETDQTALNGRAIVVAEFPDACSSDRDIEKALSNNQITDTAKSDDDGKQGGSLLPLVSKTALQVLSRKREQLAKKREELSQELLNIGDEIALCEKNIQTILEGGEDLAVQTLVDDCNERSLQTAGGDGENTTLPYNSQDLSPVVKSKRLSEANMSVISPCEELEGICSKNSWMLPTYILSLVEGGFKARVTVKGVDFHCSSEGTTCTNPLEARNAAASGILAKLRSLAAKS